MTTVTFGDVPKAWVTERQAHTNGHAAPARRSVLVVLAALAVTVVGFAGRTLPATAQIRTTVVHVAVFVAFTVAAWGVDWRLGLVVGAACGLVFDWLSTLAK